MSHRNNTSSKAPSSQITLVNGLVNARTVAILVLVLVLLITNGGAG